MVSGVTLIVQAVGLLWLGIATNAIKIVLPEIAPAADNGTTHSSAASEQQPCWDGATACMANEKCLSCVEALDTDDDGEEEEEEMSGDDDGLGELSCDTVDTLACEYFGADESCVANDEYEEYIECFFNDALEDCTLDLCGSAVGFARYSGAVVFMSAAVAGLLVTVLGATM